MLQTILLYFVFLQLEFSFKSPRECYKPAPPPQTSAQKAKFQVPKGMLQTQPDKIKLNGQESFKSPRECYKPISLKQIWEQYLGFQVPKGMLQTRS